MVATNTIFLNASLVLAAADYAGLPVAVCDFIFMSFYVLVLSIFIHADSIVMLR